MLHVTYCQQGWGGKDMSGSRGTGSTDCHCLHVNLEDGEGGRFSEEEQSLDEGTGLDVLPACLWGSKWFQA